MPAPDIAAQPRLLLPADALAGLRESTEAELARIAVGAKGGVGLAALHLQTGAALKLAGDERFPLASTVKVPLAMLVLEMASRGELSATELVQVQPQEMNPSGPLGTEFLHPGAALSLLNLVEPMITRSDNTATDVLYRLAGGPEAVMRYLQGLGVEGIRVSRTIRELLCVLYGIAPPVDRVSVPDAIQVLSAEELAAAKLRAQSPNPAYSDDPRDQATPQGMLELLRRLWQADGVSAAARDALLPIMGRTSTGLRRIEGRLPPGVAVANKTGSASGTTNDVGFVTLPAGRGTVALAIYVKASPLAPEQREEVIADLARLAYDYFVVTTAPG